MRPLLYWAVPALERAPARLAGSTLRLSLALVVAPNLVLALAGWWWVLPRPPVNLDYAYIALVYPWLGAAGAAAAAAGVALLDVVVAVTYRFHGNPGALFQAIPDVRHLARPYVLSTALGMLAAATVFTLALHRLLRRVPRRTGANIAALALAVLAGAAVDAARGEPVRRSHAIVLNDLIADALVPWVALATEYRGITDPDIPSATRPLFDAIEAGDPLPPRIVLVVVESLGRFGDPALNALQMQPFRAPALRERYRIEIGAVPFDGSTVKAEIRELCHARSASVRPDPALLPVAACLPALLEARSYRTVALHGFRPGMFDRGSWYPPLGFDEIYFEEGIAREIGVERRCGDGFRGICDDDARRLIARLLESARERVFVYWLTLNAHWPMPDPSSAPDAARLDCSIVPAAAAEPELCRLLRLHHIVFDGVVRMALRQPAGRAAFVLVGDHPAPLPDRRDRRLISPDSVPYVVIWPTAAPRRARAGGGPGGERPPPR